MTATSTLNSAVMLSGKPATDSVTVPRFTSGSSASVSSMCSVGSSTTIVARMSIVPSTYAPSSRK